MTDDLEHLGKGLAKAIVQLSSISSNLPSIVNLAISELRNIYGDDEGVGVTYVKLKLFSDRRLKIHRFDYENVEERNFVAKYIK